MDIIWNIQTGDHICDLYTKCLVKSSDRKLAWEHWRGKTKGSMTFNWHPRITLNNNPQNCNSYSTYFPIIINKANDCRKVLTFRVDKSNPSLHMLTWLNLPRLDFLPLHVNDVIAGAEGLLCVNGGEQSLVEYPCTHQSSYDSKSKYKYCKGTLKNLCEQSILLVCNPLTKEIKYLPRQTKYCVNNGLLAHMIFLSLPMEPSINDHIPKRNRSNYNLIVVGNHKRLDEQKQYVCNDVVLLTYDSKRDEWISGICIQNARLVLHVKSNIAIVGNYLFIGGQIFMGYQKQCIDETKFEIWHNKLFRINILDCKWNAIDFCIEDHDGKSIGMQAPIIVQCKPNGEVYAITRKKFKPNTIHIYQVMFAHYNPTGVMKILACMPEHVYVALLEETISLKAYECTAGLHFIAFWPLFLAKVLL